MCFRAFHFSLESSLLNGGTSILVCKRYDICPFCFVYLNYPGTEWNVVISDFVYRGSCKTVQRYIWR